MRAALLSLCVAALLALAVDRAAADQNGLHIGVLTPGQVCAFGTVIGGDTARLYTELADRRSLTMARLAMGVLTPAN